AGQFAVLGVGVAGLAVGCKPVLGVVGADDAVMTEAVAVCVVAVGVTDHAVAGDLEQSASGVVAVAVYGGGAVQAFLFLGDPALGVSLLAHFDRYVTALVGLFAYKHTDGFVG